jgi:hypothetical protein
MLEIQNIERLEGQHIGGWEIKMAQSSGPVGYLNAPHYCITFDRGGKGGAVLIDRTENPFTKQYHIYVCWEMFDNIIYQTALTKESIRRRDTFLELMVYELNKTWKLI